MSFSHFPMKIKTHLLPVLAVTTAALLTCCGKTETQTESKSAPAPAWNPADGRLIEITGDDAMKYNLTEIRATPGEKLVISLKNIGRIPKPAMAHNWVLLKPMDDAGVMAFSMSAAARPPEHLPAEMSAVLAHTKMVGNGETDMVKVTAPSAPGEHPYVCTFPGHFMLMKGKMIVK